MYNDETLFAEERRLKITEYILEHKKATVYELSERFKVSIATIRNDLRDLEMMGNITRTHGGAIRKNKTSFEPDLAKRTENILAKKNIAALALEYVEDGDTLILDSGTTIHEFAKLLHVKKDLTIITNDITCASILEASNFNIVILGGTLYNNFHWIIGEYTKTMLSDLSADKAFLAAGGFSLEKGIAVTALSLAEIKKTMIKCAAQNILLCDSSKFEKYCLAKFADLPDINIFISDVMSEDMKNKIEEADVDVVLASDKDINKKE